MAREDVPRFTAKGRVIEDYKRGTKRVEVRLYSVRFDRLIVGSEFELFNYYGSVRLKVERKSDYPNYVQLIEKEVLSEIVPGVRSEKEFTARVREFYPFPLWDKRFLAFGVVLV